MWQCQQAKRCQVAYIVADILLIQVRHLCPPCVLLEPVSQLGGSKSAQLTMLQFCYGAVALALQAISIRVMFMR